MTDDKISLFYNNEYIYKFLNLYSTDKLIIGAQYKKTPQILVTQELFNTLFNMVNEEHEYHIYYKSNDSDSLVKELNKLDFNQVNDYSIQNIRANVNSGKVIAIVIRLILYGYVLLLSIMGILTMSCVTTINFDYRKKEFILYRVIGLRFKEMMQLIFFELVYYGTKLLIYSWIVSQTLNLIVYKLYFKNIGLKFFIPLNSITGSIIIFILTIFFFMIYIQFRMKHQKYSLVLKDEMSLM